MDGAVFFASEGVHYMDVVFLDWIPPLSLLAMDSMAF